MTATTMLDTATTPISVSKGGTGNNAAAYTAAYDLLLSNGAGVTSPIYNLAAIGASGVAGNFLLDSSSFSNPTWVNVVGRLLSFQILTSGTGATYTPTSAAVTTLVVELIGGGAGGGGCTGSSTTYAASTGGSSAEYIQANLYIASGPFTYTVGAGGAGGTGNVDGTAGGVTTFGTVSTGAAPPGLASASSATATGIFTNPPTGARTVGLGLLAGTTLGQYGFYSSAICVAGSGGGSFYGGGVVGPTLTSAGTSAGVNGAPYGGGGSGCCSYLDSTNTNQTGGTGSSGLIIVWEYS